MQNFVKLVAFGSFGVLAAVACSSGGSGADAGPSDSSTPDTAKKTSDSGTAADTGTTCTAAASYVTPLTNETCTFTPTPADAGADAGPEDGYQFQGAFNTDSDLLDIELYDGYGVFTSGIAPGTYTLSGDELNYGSCGLCVLVLGDATQSSADPYMATSGSITITSVSPTGTFAGSGTNLKFTHVTIDNNTDESTPVGDGCTSSVESVSFTSTVTSQ